MLVRVGSVCEEVALDVLTC